MYARVTERLFGGPSAPVKIGRYRVLERRGEGAMGVVYAAIDERLGRKLAIKLLHPHFAGDPTGRARLLREAQAMARLRHENVVLIYDVGTHGADEEQVFIAMELVEGCNLDAWLKQAPRSPGERLAVFLQAGRALAAAHRAGVLHRDFKPENVLVDAAGRARVLDFGLARALASPVPGEGDLEDSLSEPLTRTGSILGTPAYMAPEQLRGDPVDARADQFSFCVALYEALYSARPFASVARFEPLRITPVPRDSRVPAAVRKALLRGLAEDPAARFPDMDALLAALGPPAVARRSWIAGLLLVAGAGIGAWTAAALREPGPGLDLGRGPRAVAAALEQHGRAQSNERAERRSRDVRRVARFHGALQQDPALACLLLQEIGPDEDLAGLRRQALEQPLTRVLVPAALSGALWFDAGGALVIEAEDGVRRLDRDGRTRAGPAEGPRPAPPVESAQSWPGPHGAPLLRRDDHGRLFLGHHWLRGHDGEIGAVAWSPDGTRVAVGDGAQIRIWGARGRLLATLTGHEGTVRLLAWSPEGQRLLSGGDDEQARVFHLAGHSADVGAGQPLRGHTGPISALAWHPDGADVATASRDGSVRLWTLIPGAYRRLPHPGAVHAIAWHPDGARLATASDDGKLRIYDLAALADGDAAPLTLEHGRTALSLAWSPDGQRLASAGGPLVRVWSRTGEPLASFTPGRRGEDSLAVAWTPTGDLLVAGNDDRLLLFPDGEGSQRPVSGPQGPQLRLAFAPDGAAMASVSVRGAARRWTSDLSAETAALREAGHPPGEVNDLDWCPDGLLALAREDHRVDLRSADGLIQQLNTGVPARSVACDATQLVAGLADGRLRRWWRRGGLAAHDLRGHAAEVDALALAPDGELLASGDLGGHLYLWAVSDPAIAAAVQGATRMCMSMRQRQALLDESAAEAAEGARACIRRREQGDP
jgi:WD40 repeat protein